MIEDDKPRPWMIGAHHACVFDLARHLPPLLSCTVDDALAAGRDDDPRDSDRRDAKAWLREVLADGPVGQKELKREAAEAGLAWRTVRRAKDAMKVEAYKEGFGEGARWLWALSAS